MPKAPKQLRWIGSSLDDLRSFPEEVRREVGFALYAAQIGDKPRSAKPMEGFKGASVLKIVENHDGNTYRVIYTVEFSDVIYVLHSFHKKSKSGIATPKQDIDLIKQRHRRAQEDYKKGLKNYGKSK